MTEVKAVIHLEQGALDKAPWPIGLDVENTVTSGLGPDDGAKLIGFAEPGKQELKILASVALADPELAVGLWPIFGKGGIFNWALPVRKLEVRHG